MKLSKRSLEGYLLSDNRASGGAMVEVPTLTCSHCQTQMIVNPMRTRDREYCGNCDKYICDGCGVAKKAGATCKTFIQLMDEIENTAIKMSTGF